MKTKPQTQQVTTIKDWGEADNTLKYIGIIEQKIKILSGKMNEQITKIQEQYSPEISKFEQEKLGLERDLQLYCESKRDEFDEKKTRELSFGSVSFRLSTPSLKQMKGYTWESIKNIISKSKKYADKFLRIKTDIDKNAILQTELSEKELASIGCMIEQKENFYYQAYERH